MRSDPVCKTEVEEKATMNKTFYQGKDYYFCSSACQSQFQANPEFFQVGDTTKESQSQREGKDVGITAAGSNAAGDQTSSKKDFNSQAPERKPQEKDAGMGGPSTGGTRTASGSDEQAAPLLSSEEEKDFRAQWDSLQGRFVDDPRQSVELADGLVSAVLKRLAETFADERKRLESQWDRRENVSTEDLRLALHHYRSFFSRLLSV